MLCKTLVFSLFFYLTSTQVHRRDEIVAIKNGLVRGRLDFTNDENVTYYVYQGIPYAEPSTGNSRFEPPVPKRNWSGTLDATKEGSICVQGSAPVVGSEDCLFINVYTPQIHPLYNKLLPVMVWIHGGAFEGGDSSYALYGPDYLIEKDVVFVSFNYRLGIFGFLSTGDTIVPGNNGFKDQVLALEWVRENIAHFGGNPKEITIFGQSAGSVSVSYHLQSKLSQGLFQRAILQSGVSLSGWALSRSVPDFGKRVAKRFNLDLSHSSAYVEGLKKIDFRKLQEETGSQITSDYLNGANPRAGFLLGPVIEPHHEKAFITEKSHELLKRGDFNKVPCIIGFNSLEGTFEFSTLFRLLLLKYDLDLTKLIPFDMNINENDKKSAALAIKEQYFKFGLIALSDLKLMKFLSDDGFVRPIREFVRLISKHVPVYFYEFFFEGKLWGFTERPHSGVTHSEELGYIFKSKFEADLRDIHTRRRMVKMWTDFAKTGNPTPRKLFSTSKVIWQQTNTNFTYLDINDQLRLRQFPVTGNMEFWDNFYKTYGRPPYDTY